ncbi:MAG: hypothetical protein KA765_09205 [Thermoflexales bacterium]|nr:hypothetical protein [Thermoflexales bacterium]
MFDSAHLQITARDLGFEYPRLFLLVSNELAALSATAQFQARFPRARLINSVSDIRAAHAAGVPQHFIPFLQEAQPAHIDYYCFDKRSTDAHYPIVVFAVHTVVADWPDIDAFLIWLRSDHRVTVQD